MMNRESLELYLVTDRLLSHGRDLEWIVAEAVEGGVTMVQLREKDCPTGEFLSLAVCLKKLLSRAGIPLIINDRVDIALASGADGVHIGRSDMPYGAARTLLGPDRIIGLSVENLDDVAAANALGVDYIGVSPVFPTSTKTDTAAPFGLDALQKACVLSVHPVVAIGGVNETNAAAVRDAGVDGIAVVSAIVSAPSPREASCRLRKIMDGQ